MRHTKKLNLAFEINDKEKICAAISDAILGTGNVTAFALKAGVERSMLYKSFKHNPRFGLVLKVLRTAGFYVRAIDHPKIHSQPSVIARQLSGALETGEIRQIIAALGKILRAQENVTSFAKSTKHSRETLYAAFTTRRVPRLGTVLGMLKALNLRLEISSAVHCSELPRK